MNAYRYAAATLAIALAAPGIANAAPGFTESRVALRAGPGYDYPRVLTLQRDTRVNIHGCIRRYDWCDISLRGVRGWVPGDELLFRYRGRPVRVLEYGPRISLPILPFSFDTYWDNNYRDSGFYRDRHRWREYVRRDLDRDGIPNRFDRDRDGDGVRNSRDARPNNPRVDRIDRDMDRDGVPDGRDRDRDGDGVRNRNDSAPNNPRRD